MRVLPASVVSRVIVCDLSGGPPDCAGRTRPALQDWVRHLLSRRRFAAPDYYRFGGIIEGTRVGRRATEHAPGLNEGLVLVRGPISVAPVEAILGLFCQFFGEDLASFTQVHQGFYGLVPGAAEAGLMTGELFEGALAGGGFGAAGEEGGFEGVDAVEFPLGGGHLVDQEALGGGLGLPFGFEGGAEQPISAFVFGGEHDGAGRKAVLDSVAADFGFARGGAGSGGFAGVAAVGLDLVFGGHGDGLLNSTVGREGMEVYEQGREGIDFEGKKRRERA